LKTKDFFGDNLRNLGFFDNLNKALQPTWRSVFQSRSGSLLASTLSASAVSVACATQLSA